MSAHASGELRGTCASAPEHEAAVSAANEALTTIVTAELVALRCARMGGSSRYRASITPSIAP
jgi:hypothetical protein